MIKTLYPKFQEWSRTGSIYILSDTHFADHDCKLMDPAWISPEEQVNRINKIVFKADTFICLGDVGDPEYAKQIHAGYKVLVTGNHDRPKLYRDIFDEVYTGPLFIADNILLSHEPVYGLAWCLNIHGHDHNNSEPYKEGCKHLNLAANVCSYTPVNLGQLIKGGILSDITSLHRTTIDNATKRKAARDSADECMAETKMIGTHANAVWYTPEEKAPPENESLYLTISGRAGGISYHSSPAIGTYFADEGWLIDGISPQLSDEGISVNAWCDLMPFGCSEENTEEKQGV